MTLPETPEAGDPGHLSAHIALHEAYNAWEGITPHKDAYTFILSHGGELEVGEGLQRLYLPWDIEILGVEASVGVAPTGAAVIVDVNVDGTTILSAQPTIAVSTFTASGTISDALHSAGQYLTSDIDQIGSTDPGEWLTVVITYRRV